MGTVTHNAVRSIAWVWALAPLAAQAPQFVDAGKQHLPVDTLGDIYVATAGDVDGDGDVDLVASSVRRLDHLYLYLNDGAGRHRDASERLPQRSLRIETLTLVDIDADGDLDLLVGQVSANDVYVNDGAGRFTSQPGRLPLQFENTRDFAAGDVDGDGDVDLVVANKRDPNRLYLNDGTGRFADAPGQLPSGFDPTVAVLLEDFDGDGDLDIVFGNELAANQMLRNDGTGQFTDDPTALPPTQDVCADLRAGDFDGDGDLDFILGACRTVLNRGLRLYQNDGAGHFADVNDPTLNAFPGCSALAVADLDGDGDLDLATSEDDDTRVLTNLGNGRFALGPLVRHEEPHINVSAEAYDADGDGDRDLMLVRNLGRTRLLLNDGAAVFADGCRPPLPGTRTWVTKVVALDVDRDRDLDLIECNGPTFGYANRLLLNDGRGAFREAAGSAVGGVSDSSRDVATGDVDGDGDQDLLFANDGWFGQSNRLLLGDGAGGFTDVTATHLPPDLDTTIAAVLHDLDGDGDLDALFAIADRTAGARHAVYQNDGSGRFTDVTAAWSWPAALATPRAMATDDLDGDGDLDLVLAQDGTNTVLLRQGQGFVRGAPLPGPAEDSLTVALADVDGDGDPDLLVGNDQAGSALPTGRLYLNDGAARFAQAPAGALPQDGAGSQRFVFTDLDLDGDPDLVRQRSSLPAPLLTYYRNDGRGRFAEVADPSLPRQTAYLGFGVADVDDDGDPDLVVPGRQRVLVNTHRQLHSPYLAIAGRPWTLDLYVRPGYLTEFVAIVPLVSTATTVFPLPPYGTVRLDPFGTVVQLPAVVVLPPGGRARLAPLLPPAPQFVGSTLSAQAVVLAPSGVARLTGLVSDLVSR